MGKGASQHLGEEHIKKMAEITKKRKDEATAEAHILRPYFEYGTHKEQWASADEHTRKAIIYGLVMFDGFSKMSDIERLFCIRQGSLKAEKYSEIFNSAKMALKGKIQRNMISLGLQREDLLPMKFHLGLQYAEQTLNPVHEGVEDSGAGGKEITIKVLTKDDVPGKETTSEELAGSVATDGITLLGSGVRLS